MRIGFYYHVPVLNQGTGIKVPGYFGRFLDGLATACDHLILFGHSPRQEEIANLDYCLRSNNVTLVSMGPRLPAWRMSLFPHRHIKIIKAWHRSMDVIFVRGPSALLPAICQRALDIPKALLLVGDYVRGVNDLPQPTWRKELIRIWALWNKHGQKKAAQKNLTFVNSRQLYDEYKGITSDLHEVHTTSLVEKDFYHRLDTCQKSPYHILYAGRMDRTKGLVNILEAVAFLTKGGYDLIFDLVGPAEKGDPIVGELILKAKCMGIEDKVIHHGYLPLDPDLLNLYRSSDLLVVATLSNEGFPRVIWEAMANCLPVVATRVGSIPEYIEGAAELIEPRNVEALVKGISHLINDAEYRKQCISRGFALVRKNTLDQQTNTMMNVIKNWVGQKSIKTINDHGK